MSYGSRCIPIILIKGSALCIARTRNKARYRPEGPGDRGTKVGVFLGSA